jgi:hypothetical protein
VKQDKNTTEYYVYDYQGSRVRTVIESDNQVQSQRDYLPLLDISTKQAKQTTHTYKFKPSTAPAESGLIHLASQGAWYLAP